VDLVIGDFNHAFDPGSRLAGLMDKEMNTVLLVDEAHNLPDRARSMYSSSCGKKEFLAFRRGINLTGEEGRDPGSGLRVMGKVLWRLNQVFLCHLREMEQSGQLLRYEPDIPEDLDRALKECFKEAERCLALEAKRDGNGTGGDEMSSLYFLLWELKQCFEAMDDSYRVLWERIGTDIKFHVLCVHPGRKLTEMTENMVSRVFFSATLHPIDFYRRELGGLVSEPALSFPSPFPRSNFLLLVAPFINTRHRFRAQSLPNLNEVILRALEGKTGNYLVFFPSFEYLNQSWDRMGGRDEFWFKQERNWSEEERHTFLSHFQERPEKTHVGYCVLGGIFSEGIDLLGGRLDGAVIVGVGWPPRSILAELIKEYYDTHSERTGSVGLEFAYLFPGWGRVLQAAGRVIRSETDRGFVVLAGDRFSSGEYRNLFPAHWLPPEIVSSSEDVKKLISLFWS
jgi:DNA excision repair protein ERCC-2